MVKDIVLQDSYPVLELKPTLMPLPETDSFIDLGSLGEGLAGEILEYKVAHILTVMAKPGEKKMPDRLYKTGVLAKIDGVSEEDSTVFLKGIHRVEIDKIRLNKLEYWVGINKRPKKDLDESEFFLKDHSLVVNPEIQSTMDGLFLTIRLRLNKLLEECFGFMSVDDLGRMEYVSDYFDNFDLTKRNGVETLVWNIAHSIPYTSSAEKQYFIEEPRLVRRIGGCLQLIERCYERIENGKKFDSRSRSAKTTEKEPLKEDSSNDNFMMGISEELAPKYKKFLEIKKYMSEDAIKSIMDSFKRLKSLNRSQNRSSDAEWTTFMTHVDFMLETPWHEETQEETDHNKVEETLNIDHHGLGFAKIHILRYLAGKRLNDKGKSENLCFVGPPGVGKTSLANSIAKALGRKLVRLSLGGVRDEAEIRGHRKTYIGALAGQIMQEIRRAGSKNPVFVLDELDKITADFRGDPSAALLEVLDPEQNHSFRDHYLDAPYDLSKVLFIATANNAAAIRPALLDRLELINLPGYSTHEKVEIAKKFLIPKSMKEVGLINAGIKINWPGDNPDQILFQIIKSYTKEAGVRNLERRIRTICRSLAQEYLKNKEKFLSPEINTEYLIKVLGQPRYTEHRANETGAGEAIGLAWTLYGGDILYIQSAILPEFKGKELSMTGSLGKEMQESGKVAMSLLRKKLEKEGLLDKLKDRSIHIHVPEGAIKKDGPSAGVTIYSSLYSAATGKSLRPYIAMTGEITLTGMVLRIGGVKEKVIAAENAGIKEVILPESNKGDLDEVPEDVKSKLKFHFVNNVDQILKIVTE